MLKKFLTGAMSLLLCGLLVFSSGSRIRAASGPDIDFCPGLWSFCAATIVLMTPIIFLKAPEKPGVVVRPE